MAAPWLRCRSGLESRRDPNGLSSDRFAIADRLLRSHDRNRRRETLFQKVENATLAGLAEPPALFRLGCVGSLDLSGIEARQHGLICDQRTKRLHKVQRKRGAAAAGLMKNAEPRIEANSGDRADAFRVQHRIGVREDRVDRVLRRVARADVKLGVARPACEDMRPGGEVMRRGCSFEAKQALAGTGMLRSLCEGGERGEAIFSRRRQRGVSQARAY